MSADEWPRFRGPSAGVAADDPALPDTWSPTQNVVWKTDIPGIGWSSPVVWGDHVFLTTVVNTTQQEPPRPGFYLGDWPPSGAPHRWMVYDIDFRTGKIRWEREVSSAPPAKAKHLKNSYASETPVTDGERVYFYFGNAGLFVFDLDGRPVWSKPIGPFKTRNNWGSAASPVLHGDRIYVVNDNDEQSYLAAYDKRTGAEIWKVNRAEGTNWTTPFVWENSAEHRDRHVGLRPRPFVRSVRQGSVGALGDVHDQHPDAIRSPWAALHRIGVYRRPACVRRTRFALAPPATSR